MTARRAGRDRRDQPGIAQGLHPGARDRRQKQILQRQHVVVDRRDGQADLVHPVEHAGQPVQSGRIERRAHEPGPVGAVGDGAVAFAAQRAKRRKPSGVARPRGKAGRAMHEADALPRHRIFVAAGEIERAAGNRSQTGRQRHEAVIAVEHDQCVAVTHRAGDIVERAARCGRIEEDLADIDEIVAATTRGGCEALGKARERLSRDPLDGNESVFFQAGDLAREGMKFAVAGENARRRAGRQCREQAADKVVGVGRDRDGGGIRQRQHGGNARAARAAAASRRRPPISRRQGARHPPARGGGPGTRRPARNDGCGRPDECAPDRRREIR